MKADETKYTCGVCHKTQFDNIQKFPIFGCDKCQASFIRDNIGIKIVREPSQEWKKRNKQLWDSAKEIISPDNYIETF